MKRRFGLLLFLALVIFTAAAVADVVIDERNFPDTHFRAIVKTFDLDEDGILSRKETREVVSLVISDRQIADLKGIEYFTKLRKLDCSNNHLKKLNVGRNTELTALKCGNNQLTKLDVSSNKKLDLLSCHSNQLTKLELYQNSELISLSCNDNQLTNLDLRKNPKLTSLSCMNNQLKTLDISACTDLKYLWCYSNRLMQLDLNNNRSLCRLMCYANPLVKLDIRKCSMLDKLVSKEASGYHTKYGFGWWKRDMSQFIFLDEHVILIANGYRTVLVASIQLNKTKATLKKGDTLVLKIKELLPADATNKKVVWSSSDEEIAETDQNGKIKAKKKGKCTITCAAVDGSGVKAVCRITVKDEIKLTGWQHVNHQWYFYLPDGTLLANDPSKPGYEVLYEDEEGYVYFNDQFNADGSYNLFEGWFATSFGNWDEVNEIWEDEPCPITLNGKTYQVKTLQVVLRKNGKVRIEIEAMEGEACFTAKWKRDGDDLRIKIGNDVLKLTQYQNTFTLLINGKKVSLLHGNGWG